MGQPGLADFAARIEVGSISAGILFADTAPNHQLQVARLGFQCADRSCEAENCLGFVRRWAVELQPCGRGLPNGERLRN